MIVYPKPHSVYLRGTIGFRVFELRVRGLEFRV